MAILSRPFKGTWYYEWQVGPLVIQWLHDLSVRPGGGGMTWGRLHLWIDPMWRLH